MGKKRTLRYTLSNDIDVKGSTLSQMEDTENDMIELIESEMEEKKLRSKPNGPSATHDLLNKRRKGLKDIYDGTKEQRKLNTNDFQAYLEYLWRNVFIDISDSFTCFDCLWFNLYTNPLSRSKVLLWIKEKNVFSKKYIFVPICLWGHWSLIILCHLGESEENSINPPVMVLLDSLLSINPTELPIQIRKFVLDIYVAEGRGDNEEGISSIPLLIPQVPQQVNGSECGFFVLYYIYLFMQTAPQSFCLDGYPYFLTKDWFSRPDFDLFRDGLTSRSLCQISIISHPSHKQVKENLHISSEASTTRKHRGPNTARDVHGMGDGKRIQVRINELGQPIGEGGHSLKLFLGTIARFSDKLPIDKENWKAVPTTCKDDVWEYIKRKYDILECTREWVMKDLNQKWRSWKQELRNKYFNPGLKASQQKIPTDSRVNEEQWKRVVVIWCSTKWKRYSEINKENKKNHKFFHCAGTKSFADINEEEYQKNGVRLHRGDLFIKTRIKKDGVPVNEDCATMIAKLQDQKITQAHSLDGSIATIDDTYAQVFGKDRPGRIRGVSTGPTPKSLWGGVSTQVQQQEENFHLTQFMKDMADKISKIESVVLQGKKSGEKQYGSSSCVQSSPKEQVQGKRVKLLDLGGEEVASGMLMSDDKEKVVMGKVLGDAFYEVSIFLAIKPDAPLFIKDVERKKIQDAVGSHVVWLKDYVQDA